MKSVEDFQKFYDSVLVKELQKLEEHRLYILEQKDSLAKKAGLAIIAHGVLVVIKALVWPTFFITLVLAPYIARKIYLTKYKYDGFNDDFKKIVVSKIIAFLDPCLKYDAKGKVAYKTFLESRLFNLIPDNYSGEDYVKGKLKGIEIEFSELYVAYHKNGIAKKELFTYWVDMFKGLFYVGNYEKGFKGTTLILPSNLVKDLTYEGRILQKDNFYDLKKIPLPSNPDFEDKYVILSSTIYEGELIASDLMTSTIIEFTEKTGTELFISFTNNKIYIGINKFRDLFELDQKKSFLDFGYIYSFYYDLTFALELIAQINTNKSLLKLK